MSPLELRLRLRIDKLMDERDKARELHEEARVRAEKWRLRAYERSRTTKLTKERLRICQALLDASQKQERKLRNRLRTVEFQKDFQQRMAVAG